MSMQKSPLSPSRELGGSRALISVLPQETFGTSSQFLCRPQAIDSPHWRVEFQGVFVWRPAHNFLQEGNAMNARKILFPTDFSDLSHEALATASSMARDRGATLLILHVGVPLTVAAGESHYGLTEPNLPELRSQLEDIHAAVPDVVCEHRVETGDPSSAIVRVAREEGCDMIVMATHGRRGISRLFMGSVTEEVMRHAPCPVLTVKHRGPAPALA
jgi:nucleotide-binding universal stress UspA family protein